MYSLEKKQYGLRVTLSGFVSVSEVMEIKTELATILKTVKRPFGTIADVRDAVPFEPEVISVIKECEQMEREAGIQRRAIILQSPVIKGQAIQLSIQTSTDHMERHINASLTDDWEELALAWVVEGIEPTFTPKLDIGFI